MENNRKQSKKLKAGSLKKTSKMDELPPKWKKKMGRHKSTMQNMKDISLQTAYIKH